ncbi:MAG: hypothetical protein QW569_03870 [Candidatus Bathyarchaeia archaeon]|nr:hypothetical protein [Candidatus Bathyarchaeota archaeon]
MMGTFLAIRLIDRIIAVSHFLKRKLEKRYLVKPDNKVIYNGVTWRGSIQTSTHPLKEGP